MDKFTTAALRQLRSAGRVASQLLWLLAGALLREDRDVVVSGDAVQETGVALLATSKRAE